VQVTAHGPTYLELLRAGFQAGLASGEVTIRLPCAEGNRSVRAHKLVTLWVVGRVTHLCR